MRESVPFDVRRSRLVSALQPAFVAASVAWAVMLPLAPYLASRPQASPLATAFVVAVYGIGSLICHQLPERSYRLWTAQMPVCARCAGMYFGAAIAAIAAAPLKRRPTPAPLTRRLTPAPLMPRPTTAPPTRRPTYDAVGHRFSGANPSRATLVIAALPTLLTLVYEWMTGHAPGNWIRFAAGMPIGGAVAWLVIEHARGERPVHPEPVEG